MTNAGHVIGSERESGRPLDSDLRAHAEHLRLVHFTLVTVCLGLAAAASSDTTSDVRRAYDDVTGVVGLQDHWDRQWLRNYVDGVVKKYKEAHSTLYGEGTRDIVVVIDSVRNVSDSAGEYGLERKEWSLEWSLFRGKQSSSPTGSDPTREVVQSYRGIMPYEDNIVAKPDTLHQFQVLWETLGSLEWVDVFTALYDKALISEKDPYDFEKPEKPWTPKKWVSSRQNVEDNKQKPELVLDAHSVQTEARDWPSGSYYSFSDILMPSDVHVIMSLDLPIISQRVTIEPQLRLTELAKSDWSGRTFEKAFPELFSISENIRDLPLPQLRSHLRSQLGRSGDRFSVFGVSMPRSTLSLWGVIVLLGTQLYCLLHLIAFARLVTAEDAAWTVPWIGMYSNLWSRLVVVVTLVLAPPFVSSMLFYYDIGGKFSWVYWIRQDAFLLICVGLSGMTSVALRTLWRLRTY